MDSRDDHTDPSAIDDAEPTTSTGQSDEDTDEIDGFIFNNSLESDSCSPEHEAERPAERDQKHIVDLVRLQPTKNAELQDQWGLASGSAIHQYLESQLKEYYYRDDDGYIQATDAAEKFAQHHQDVYQKITEPEDDSDANDAAPDLQRRDLVIALVTLTQELGHLPSADEINEHGEYQHQRYRQEFGDLFNAYQAAGILPDDVTRQDFYGEAEVESKTEDEAKTDEESKSLREPEQEDEVSESEEPERDAPDPEPAEIDVTKVDLDRPNDHIPDDFDKTDLIEEIQRFAELIDEPPTEELLKAYGRFPIDAYRRVFGSWENSLEAAGFHPTDLPDYSLRMYTNVEILDGIHAVANELGRSPKTTEVEDFVEFSTALATVRFGSWDEALEAAGVGDTDTENPDTTNVCGQTASQSTQNKAETSLPSQNEAASSNGSPTSNELIEELQRLDDETDGYPLTTEVRSRSQYDPQQYYAEFGSWDDALRAAGIDKGQRLLEEIHRVAKIVGSRPTTTTMNEHGAVSTTTHSNHFGSWTKALSAAEEKGYLEVDDSLSASADKPSPDTTDSSATSTSEASTSGESSDLVENLMKDLQEDL